MWLDMEVVRQRSKAWYVLPILLHIIGGIIAYYAVRKDDPKLAKSCVKVGLIFMVIQIIAGISTSIIEHIFS